MHGESQFGLSGASKLWPFETRFPDWNPVRLHQLFMLFNGAPESSRQPTAGEREEFARLLMLMVGAYFSRVKCFDVLNQSVDGAGGVASKLVLFLIDRAPRFKCRVPWEQAGYKAVIKSLNTCIYRKVLEEIESIKGNQHRQGFGNPDKDGSYSAIDNTAAPARGAMPADLTKLELALSSDDSIDRACLAVDGDIYAIENAAKMQISSILQANDLVPLDHMPRDVRLGLTDEAHALITSRVNRLVRQYAASLS